MRDALTADRSRRTPNVVLIVTDDQGYGDYGRTGNPWLKTPALDALYDGSVRLQNFHTDPMCAPSRAALLTGRDSARAGVWSTLTGRYFLNRDVPTMGDVFRAGGYRTGMFGKWHMGDGRRYLPHERGFDHTLHHGGGVIGEMPDAWGNDYFNATFLRNGRPERVEDTYCTDVWFGEADRFITRSMDADQPFLCYLAANAPHTPHDVHARYAQPYLDQGLEPGRARFFGMIANLDENVGRLRGRLEALGVARDTVLIYMGDNGTAGGAEVDGEGFLAGGFNAGMRGKKCWATDGGHRNLCLVRWPGGGWEGGRDVEGLTAHLDLLPTLRSVCGLGRAETDGRDLGPVLAGGSDTLLGDRTLVIHNQQRDNPEKFKDYEVLTRDWRLVHTREWGPGRRELTDARADPGQQHDRSADRPEVVAELAAVYERWWAGLAPGFDQVWPFYLDRGVDRADAPLEMTAHAWHGTTSGPGIYDQNHCREAVVQNGYFLVEVQAPGDYFVELRRWPRACGAGLRAGLPPRTGVPHVADRPAGVALAIKTARLTITPDDGPSEGGRKPVFDATVVVDDAMAAVTHRVRLDTGRVRMKTWLTDETAVERGAYYVYVWGAEEGR